ncbi:molecular chaperone HscC [Clostridium botulinum]|uniref:Chaperone protein DnaK n=2 Tax=Clostridium TaxID=1485 RepID=B2TKX0_CLOBB|nr:MULTISPECIES: molecular chaperone HscC [unclassified Clostridium]ACD24927.1 chaperone protein, Hsp70 family [Clostridium botulinum B str. Eklund 17B (NRP)]MBY6974544.1 Hsp70 family protein [Clostridium botulinum]MBY6999529.1 Hsp70 family protein [Clostridium botulinum]MBZ9691451.1 Hsp70 family protein [Clostridium sp. M14]MCR1275248.1 Hsp70 family protein [Clostridium botulinum]
MAIIGIDLGTTNSLVSHFTEDGPAIIPNRLGDLLTPSVVSIDENEQIYIGKIARERQSVYPDNTVSIFKRSMGSEKVFKLGSKEFLPEELSSFVLRSLKEDAEFYLKEEVVEAIISVPAYFNDAQRKATKRAGELAGLKVERLINEPTAAAIAYGLNQKKDNTKFLVFDLGGGTFDVSILELYKNIMEVRAVAGNNYLGGEDFTEIIENMFINSYKLDKQNLDNKTLSNIRRQAEITKLSFSKEKDVIMKCKVEEEVLQYSLNLDDYEKSCQLILKKLRRPIERALSDASIKIREIDSIVLVGGATKLPIIRNFVAKLFGRLPLVHINPDEAVALGAAIQGAMKSRNKAIREIVLTDVCPYTLGTSISIEKANGNYESGHFYPIIERNTIIPVSKIDRLYTIYDNQNFISVKVLQGESRLSKDNIYLGEINVPVPKGKGGEQSIDIRYTYDINGILEVEVTVVSTEFKKRIVIRNNSNSMSDEEVEKRLEELKELKIHPREEEEIKLLLSRGERLYEENIGERREYIAKLLEEFENILDKQDKREAEKAAKELKEVLENIDDEWL